MEDDKKKIAEGADVPVETDTPAEPAPEPEQDKGTQPEEAVDPEPQEVPAEPEPSSELDELKAENLRLKAQIEAVKLGIVPANVEDAVTLAEAIVKRDGKDITAALNAVAEKYPDWKAGAEPKASSAEYYDTIKQEYKENGLDLSYPETAYYDAVLSKNEELENMYAMQIDDDDIEYDFDDEYEEIDMEMM